MELWEAVYISKNLKGFYLPSKSGAEEEIKFLKKKFKYSRIGVLSTHLKNLGDSMGEPLYIIDPEAISCSIMFSEDAPFITSLLPLSSLFMVPILASPLLRKELESTFLWSIQLPQTFTPSEFRFNLRLLTYLPVDMAPKDSRALRDIIALGAKKRYTKERANEIIKDAEKRFWRLRDEAGKGPTRVGIIDPFQYIKGPFKEEDISFLLPSGVIFLEE